MVITIMAVIMEIGAVVVTPVIIGGAGTAGADFCSGGRIYAGRGRVRQADANAALAAGCAVYGSAKAPIDRAVNSPRNGAQLSLSGCCHHEASGQGRECCDVNLF